MPLSRVPAHMMRLPSVWESRNGSSFNLHTKISEVTFSFTVSALELLRHSYWSILPQTFTKNSWYSWNCDTTDSLSFHVILIPAPRVYDWNILYSLISFCPVSVDTNTGRIGICNNLVRKLSIILFRRGIWKPSFTALLVSRQRVCNLVLRSEQSHSCWLHP